MKSAVECVELVDKDKKYIDENFVREAIKSGLYFPSGENFSRCDISEITLPTLKDFLKKYPQFISGGEI